ncbi:MAG: 5-oxoprolinase subunit PxpA [Bryobacteraceae bacterium]
MIDLNCDMGEMQGEERLYEYITSANIACGGHAGDAKTMQDAVALARKWNVAVGAHPGYPDRENFGRLDMRLTAEEIEQTVFEQVSALAGIAEPAHVKPHGALYNRAARDSETAAAIARGVGRWSREPILVGLADSVMLDVWREMGFRVAAEGFADRRYEPDGSLRSRAFQDALIADPAEAARQALRLAREGRVNTICVHGDTPGAAGILAAVHACLQEHGLLAHRKA